MLCCQGVASRPGIVPIGHSAISSQDLVNPSERCPRHRVYGAYELVRSTQHALDLAAADDPAIPFGRAHVTINAILIVVARYSAQAALDPGKTCEFPPEMEAVGGHGVYCCDGGGNHSPASLKIGHEVRYGHKAIAGDSGMTTSRFRFTMRTEPAGLSLWAVGAAVLMAAWQSDGRRVGFR